MANKNSIIKTLYPDGEHKYSAAEYEHEPQEHVVTMDWGRAIVADSTFELKGPWDSSFDSTQKSAQKRWPWRNNWRNGGLIADLAFIDAGYAIQDQIERDEAVRHASWIKRRSWLF